VGAAIAALLYMALVPMALASNRNTAYLNRWVVKLGSVIFSAFDTQPVI